MGVRLVSRGVLDSCVLIGKPAVEPLEGFGSSWMGFRLGLMLSSVFADSLGNLVPTTRGPFASSVARSD